MAMVKGYVGTNYYATSSSQLVPAIGHDGDIAYLVDE